MQNFSDKVEFGRAIYIYPSNKRGHVPIGIATARIHSTLQISKDRKKRGGSVELPPLSELWLDRDYALVVMGY